VRNRAATLLRFVQLNKVLLAAAGSTGETPMPRVRAHAFPPRKKYSISS
jgi:hypothetical protein